MKTIMSWQEWSNSDATALAELSNAVRSPQQSWQNKRGQPRKN
jgi:hypothetical protein